MVQKQRTPPSKRQLEIRLGKLATLDNPRLSLEQYPVSPEAASELLYMAGFEHNDLDERIVDLGTGTGILAIGSALMGAKDILGLDIDRQSIQLAVQNSRSTGVDIDWVVGGLNSIRGPFNTVVMNPPYGTRVRHSDTLFLSRAFELAPVTYTIHKSSTRPYLVQFVKNQGRHVDQARSLKMQIPHLFSFHRKKWETVTVDLYRIVS